MRIIYKCKNKACGKVRTFDYPESQRVHVGYGRMETKYWRVDAKRGKVNAGYDGVCECGKVASSNLVKGTRTEHVCDARCMGSTSGKCECACGGKNHGSAYTAA